MSHESVSISSKLSLASIRSNGTGKYGGERYAAIFSLSVPFAGRGPWILIVDSGIEEKREEAEALDVVEVEMGEQQVEVVERFVGQGAAEIPDARACVDDDDRTAGASQLQARRVAAVTHGRLARCGERASASPDPRLHGGEP